MQPIRAKYSVPRWQCSQYVQSTVCHVGNAAITYNAANFFESKHFIYSVRNVHSRETEQHYLNILM